MPTTAKRLFDPVQLTTVLTGYYTAPVSGTYTVLRNLTLCNTTGSSATVTLNIVPADGTASPANAVSNVRAVPANGTWQASEAIGHVLNPGDSIFLAASVAGAITAICSGIEVT